MKCFLKKKRNLNICCVYGILGISVVFPGITEMSIQGKCHNKRCDVNSHHGGISLDVICS